MGMNTSMPGQEGIPSVFSPMARTLEDLVYFSRSLIGMKPWFWDHTVHPIEWRAEEERKVKETKKFTIGVMRTDGKTDRPGPARLTNSPLSRFKELSTHPQPALVHSNAPYPLFLPTVIPSSMCTRPLPTPLSSSPPSFSTPMAVKRSSRFFEQAKLTTLVLVKCRYI